MNALRVRIEGSFASFRIRSQMRYQRSYPLPPKTVFCGLLGAALGYSESEALGLLQNTTGILEEGREGVARDLWRITKLKTGLEAESAVILKEYLVHPRYSVYYGAGSEETLMSWKASFTRPSFPLSLGSSDDLCLVKDASLVELHPCQKGAVFRNTILPFNYKKQKTKLAKIKIEKGTKIEMPQVFSGATAFENDGKVRKGINMTEFTYVPATGLEVSDVHGAWTDANRSFFMF